MSPLLRNSIAILFVVACLAAATYVVTRGANPGAGIGAAIGVIVVFIMNNRARRRRSL